MLKNWDSLLSWELRKGKIHEEDHRWQCQRGIKVKEGKSGGKVFKCMTKCFLGDLWVNTLGEGKGTTHQQGV